MVGFVAFSFSLWFLCHSCIAEVLGVSFQEQRLLVVVGTAQMEHARGPLRLCEIVLPFDFTCAFLVQGSTVLKVQHLQTILVSRLVAVGISHQAASCFAQQWL